MARGRRQLTDLYPYRRRNRAYCLRCGHDMPKSAQRCRRRGSARLLRYYTGDAPEAAALATEVDG